MGNNQSSTQQITQTSNNASTTLVAPERKSEKMIKVMNNKLINTVDRKNNLFEQVDTAALHFSKVIFDTISDIKLLLLDNENNFLDYNYDKIIEKLRVIYLLLQFFTEHHNLCDGNRQLENKKVKNEQAIYDISNNLDKAFEYKLELIDDKTKTVFEEVRAFENKDSPDYLDSDGKQVEVPIEVLQTSFKKLRTNGFRFQDAIEYLRIANTRLIQMSDNYVKYYRGENTDYDKNYLQMAKESFGYYVGEMIFSYGYFSNDRTLDSKAKFYQDFKLNKLRPFENKISRFNHDYKLCLNIIKETIRKFEYWDCPIIKNVNNRLSFYFEDVDSYGNLNDNDDDDEDVLLGKQDNDEDRTLTLNFRNCNMVSYLDFEGITKEMLEEDTDVDTTFVDNARLNQNRRSHTPNTKKLKIDYVYEENSTISATPTVGPAPPASEKSALRSTYNIPNEQRFLFRSKTPFKIQSNKSTVREYFGFGSGRGDFHSSTKTFSNGEVVHYIVSQFPVDFDRNEKANNRIRQIAINLEQVCQKMKFTRFKEIEASR